MRMRDDPQMRQLVEDVWAAMLTEQDLTEQEPYWGTEFVDTYIPLLQKVKYKILSYDYFYVF